MFTSDNAARKDGYGPVIGGYLLAAGFCALFGAVYEHYSHGVFSGFMICAFAFPLLLGTAPFFLLRRSGKPFPGGFAAAIIHAGVAALTVGSIVRGALDIYGTANPLVSVYWIAGGLLTAAGWLSAVVAVRSGRAETGR